MSGHDQDELRRQVTRLKNCDAAKFKTLCHMHLSFLLDLDGASFEDFLNEDQPDSKKKSHNFKHFGRKKSKGDRNEMMVPQLRAQSVNNIEILIRYLSQPENLRLEGLFRKSGQLSRQRTLRDRIEMGESLESELETGMYTGHDCANLLKALLGELPEPLLTEKHFSIYLKLPDMIQPSMSPTDFDLMAERQVATAQLLLQLLPRDNVQLLKAVVSLLHKVACMEGNLMTSETLGTMFAPHILVPRRMSASELQQITTLTTRAVAFLIDHAPELFKVPQPLMRDISAYWKEMEEALDSRNYHKDEIAMQSCQHRSKKDADELRTTVTFVDRKALQRPNVQTDTQVELAQLYAHISTMPESAKKRKLLKQFNRANGVGTPLPSAAKHKRSKSLSESIKKMVGRSNHKRRGSGNSDHTSEPSVPAAKQQTYTPLSPPTIVQHTPIIKSMTAKSSAMTASSNSTCSSPAPFASPVVRLFKETMDQPIAHPNLVLRRLKSQKAALQSLRSYSGPEGGRSRLSQHPQAQD